MSDIPIRELRNNGGDVTNRVLAGEAITVTRAGQPVMHLQPVPQERLNRKALLSRWRNIPHLDSNALRTDLAEVIDDAL